LGFSDEVESVVDTVLAMVCEEVGLDPAVAGLATGNSARGEIE
jgi:hypothetical protein